MCSYMIIFEWIMYETEKRIILKSHPAYLCKNFVKLWHFPNSTTNQKRMQ